MPAPARLTICLGTKSEGLSTHSLSVVLNETSAILGSLAKVIYEGETKRPHWSILEISMHSPLEMVIGSEEITCRDLWSKVVRECVDGIGALEKSAKIPDMFNAECMKHAKQLVSVLNDGVAFIKMYADKTNQISLTQHLAANVDAICFDSEKDYYLNTTLEGRVEAVVLWGQKRFDIVEPLDGKRIECLFKNDELKEQAIEFLRKEERVSVRGRAKYNKHNEPKSIEVEGIERLPGKDESISSEDIGPIDITGGVDSKEHVWRVHNG